MIALNCAVANSGAPCEAVTVGTALGACGPRDGDVGETKRQHLQRWDGASNAVGAGLAGSGDLAGATCGGGGGRPTRESGPFQSKLLCEP